MSAVLLDTTNLEEAVAVVSANYTKIAFGDTHEGRTRSRAVRFPVGSMGFDRFAYSWGFRFEGDPTDGIILCRTKYGALQHRQPGEDVAHCPSGAATVLAAREGVPFTGRISTGEFHTVVLDRGILGAAAAPPPTRGTADAVRLTGSSPISPAANDQLVRAIDYVYGVAADPVAADSPFIEGALARLLAANMLAAFPNTALLDPTIEDRHDSTPILLRRAIAFIDDNAHRDITTSDVAAAVYVTPRALQYMFRKHRDRTPMQYLRRVRLHHAHHALVHADRSKTTVGEVARAWGFVHLGRFAVYYRGEYGESPHQTLRR